MKKDPNKTSLLVIFQPLGKFELSQDATITSYEFAFHQYQNTPENEEEKI